MPNLNAWWHGVAGDVAGVGGLAPGVVERVGMANQFGVSQGNVFGLAEISGTVYMLGVSPRALYTLDLETGVATLVNTFSQFMVRLAAVGNVLYCSDNSYLYTMNTSTAAITNRTNFTFSGFNVFGTRMFSGGSGMMAIRGSGTRKNLYDLSTTGVLTQSRALTGDIGVNFDGGARIGNSVYLNFQTYVSEVSLATNVATRLGNITNFDVGESSGSAMLFSNNNLYMTGRTNDALYRLGY